MALKKKTYVQKENNAQEVSDTIKTILGWHTNDICKQYDDGKSIKSISESLNEMYKDELEEEETNVVITLSSFDKSKYTKEQLEIIEPAIEKAKEKDSNVKGIRVSIKKIPTVYPSHISKALLESGNYYEEKTTTTNKSGKEYLRSKIIKK